MKITENAPKLLAQTRDEVQIELQDDIKKTVDRQLGELKLDSLNEEAVTSKLARIYQETLDVASTAWEIRAKQTLDSIKKMAENYSELRAAYAALVERVREESLQYFADSSRNLSVLNQVADRIRAKAIRAFIRLAGCDTWRPAFCEDRS